MIVPAWLEPLAEVLPTVTPERVSRVLPPAGGGRGALGGGGEGDGGSAKRVGAGLGHGVNRTARRASVLGAIPVQVDAKLLDRFLAELIRPESQHFSAVD